MSRPAGRRVAERPARRRVAMPRLRADLVIGLVAVLVTGATLATVADPDEPQPEQARAPGARQLTEAVLACPGGSRVSVAQPVAEEGDGALTIASDGAEARPIDLAPGGVVDTAVDGPSVLHAAGALAPGLIAAVEGPSVRSECVAPAGEWWFAAVGAGGLHVSTLTLSNPDDGPAIADLEVWGPQGPVTSEAIRGIAVDGGQTVTRDLAELVPSRDDVVVRVLVRQGRLGVSMRDQTVVAADPLTAEHPATSAPTTRAVLPAVPSGQLRLVIGNPSDEAARAQLKVSGAESESVPLDVDPVPVPAGEVVSVPLDANTRKLLRSGEASLVVEGTAPLVSSVAGVVAGRPVTMTAVDAAAARSAVFLPDLAQRTLVLTASEHATPVTVRFLGGGEDWKGRLQPQVSTAVPVPKGAQVAWVETDAPHLGAVRGQGPAGLGWLPLRELREERLVPVVRPDQLHSGG